MSALFNENRADTNYPQPRQAAVRHGRGVAKHRKPRSDRTRRLRGRGGFAGRVDLGGCPPRSPTDPGLHITRTRFLIS